MAQGRGALIRSRWLARTGSGTGNTSLLYARAPLMGSGTPFAAWGFGYIDATSATTITVATAATGAVLVSGASETTITVVTAGTFTVTGEPPAPEFGWSEAMKEAMAYADATQVIYHTLELWHPTFSEPLYVVRDHVALDARIEGTADRNASDIVTFAAVKFDFVPPEMTAAAVPSCTVEIDNVDASIGGLILAACRTTDPVTLIYRAYLDGALDSGPENDPPLQMELQTATITPFRIRGTAGFPQLHNRRFPAQQYTLARFPGLAL